MNSINSPLYVSLDTNILKDFCKIKELIENSKNSYLKKKQLDNQNLKKNPQFYKELYYLMRADVIRFHVSQYVLYEIGHNDTCLDFVKSFCYLDNITPQNKEFHQAQINLLSSAYSSPLEKNNIIYPPSIEPQMSISSHKIVPTIDAKKLASATVSGSTFFLVSDQNELKKNKRKIGIVHNNTKFGFCDAIKIDDQTETIVTTVPITISSLAKICFHIYDEKNESVAFFRKPEKLPKASDLEKSFS